MARRFESGLGRKASPCHVVTNGAPNGATAPRSAPGRACAPGRSPGPAFEIHEPQLAPAHAAYRQAKLAGGAGLPRNVRRNLPRLFATDPGLPARLGGRQRLLVRRQLREKQRRRRLLQRQDQLRAGSLLTAPTVLRLLQPGDLQLQAIDSLGQRLDQVQQRVDKLRSLPRLDALLAVRAQPLHIQ